MTTKEKVTHMLNKTLIQSGVTPAKMADKMKISKKTVYNWLSGASYPTLPQTIEWFDTLKIPFIPEMLNLYYAKKEETSLGKTDEEITEELNSFLKNLSHYRKRQLHYIFCGGHGSSPIGVLQFVTAYLQIPMFLRLGPVSLVVNYYKIARHKNELVCPEDIQPDIDLLEQSLEHGVEAVKEGLQRYTI